MGFIIFLIASTAEVVRSPFDLVEAEQELVGGYNPEYGSMKFAFLFSCRNTSSSVAMNAIAVTLFLGGGSLPGIEQASAAITASYGVTAGNAGGGSYDARGIFDQNHLVVVLVGMDSCHGTTGTV
jgi:NADH-quinone oxidoreductase subunit H